MSIETLNLLSDSTFGDKLDEQNAILEDIRDNIGGGGNLAGTIATIETSPAAVAHAVGEYIYYNSELYKVTAAIAIGDTLTAGTNITKTTVMGEVQAVSGVVSRTLTLEANSNPNGGAECILVRANSNSVDVSPTSENIINAKGVNNTRAECNLTADNVIHIFVKISLYPSGLDYTSQAYCTTLETKYNSNSLSKAENGFLPFGLFNSVLTGYISVGDTFTNNNNEAYRHIIVTRTGGVGYHTLRVKIDY